MLEHAAELHHRGERRFKTPAVITEDSAYSSRWPPKPVPPPALTWRVRHNRPWPGVPASVASLIPRVHIRQAEVAAVLGNKQRGNHGLGILTTASLGSISIRWHDSHDGRQAVTSPALATGDPAPQKYPAAKTSRAAKMRAMVPVRIMLPK